MDLSNFSVRQLQLESERALSTMQATNDDIWQFNKKEHQNSQNWYVAVIEWYVEQYGDLPSKTGPGKDVKLIHDV